MRINRVVISSTISCGGYVCNGSRLRDEQTDIAWISCDRYTYEMTLMLREHMHVTISISALSYEENNIVKGKKINLTILVFPSFKCFLAFS